MTLGKEELIISIIQTLQGGEIPADTGSRWRAQQRKSHQLGLTDDKDVGTMIFTVRYSQSASESLPTRWIISNRYSERQHQRAVC